MSNNPLITVITPYHNVDHALFEGAAASIAAQTLDRDLIEWIVVVHNSDPGESEFVRSVTEPLGCAKVFDLNNDIHSASSPRNHALSLVTGTYITFLDADDTLSSDCLLTITNGMESTGADIGKYRGETSEDDAIVNFLDTRVRFPQTRPLLLLHKGDSDIKKLLTMTSMMMNCQVIRRDFLEKNSIRFREDIRIEEDVIFNLQSISCAESIAVFPQLIGYIYYMHQGSTMQEKNLSSDTLLSTCSDLAKQLDIGLDAGLYMNYLFLGHMDLVSQMIAKSDANDETRRRIRDIFIPYFKRIDMPEPDEKIMPQDIIDKTRKRVENDVLFLDDPSMTDGILRKILHENASTELGQEWGFEKIFDHDDYIAAVPVTNYDSYAPYIELTTRIGESDIFLHDSIKGYALTSGTTGVPRRIPFSAKQLGFLTRIMDRIEECSGSTYLMMQSIRSDEKYADDTWLDSVSGAILQAARNRLKFSSYSLKDKRGSVTSPEGFVFASEPFMATYKRLLYALLDKDVHMIFAPFTWQVFISLRKLEEDPERIIRDLSDGTVADADKYKDRIKQLQSVFAEGFDTPVVPRIWPDLNVIIAGNSGTFAIYGDNLKRYTGNIPIEGYYVSSEGIHGISDSSSGGYRLLCNENYYEFLEIGKTEAVSAAGVIPGKTYEIIVTNRSGFYRYALGDMVKILSVENGIPTVEVPYRKADILHLPENSGHLAPNEVYDTIRKLSEETGQVIYDYCYALSEDGKCLELFLETETDDRITETADSLLMESSCAYKAARQSGKIGPVKCLFTQPQTQEAYSEYVSFRTRTSPDQIKPVRHLDNPVKRRFFETMLLQEF